MTYTPEQINAARQRCRIVLEREDLRWSIDIEDLYAKYVKYKAEHGDDLTVDIDAFEEYGSVTVDVEFITRRLETDAEVIERLNLDATYAANRRARDLKELERLKKLYE